ncbi:ATP synthase F1 subunit delta [[Mycoplasma] testudinis]|uniref:ATP synthase F1 subunit delta n=1 Tax=[Mycoplasma] testudinis TaxID=33924 RepID=UPI00048994EF|nr:ATP synthase F1 subunit delta [[Mycoplasma] testudinis]
MNKTRLFSFARALYDLAEEKNLRHEIYQQALDLMELVQNNPDLLNIFCSPIINQASKNDSVTAIFGKFLNPLFCDFLRVVIDMREFHSIRLIIKKFLGIVEQVEHVRYVRVTSAYPLTTEQLDKIKKILEKKLATHLIVHTKIDPSVIAGVRVETESKSFDSTIPGKLKNIKGHLLLQLAGGQI